jgi:hypothetical protein
MALGSYHFRLAVLGRHQVVLVHQPRVLRVFGRVPLATLLGEGAKGGVYATPTVAFPYATEIDDQIDGDHGQGVITASRNPCQSVFLEWVPGTWSFSRLPAQDFIGDVGTLSVVQQSESPVSVAKGFDEVGSATVGLMPGQTWSVNLAQTPNAEELYFYVNGYAICDSTAPLA